MHPQDDGPGEVYKWAGYSLDPFVAITDQYSIIKVIYSNSYNLRISVDLVSSCKVALCIAC